MKEKEVGVDVLELSKAKKIGIDKLVLSGIRGESRKNAVITEEQGWIEEKLERQICLLQG